MAFFEVRNLRKCFGRQVVLQDINMTFKNKRLTGIMGPNGAGKTTCFNLLTGRYKPDGGSIMYSGREVSGFTPRSAAMQGVSRSFQTINLFNEYTALETVLIALPEMRRRGFDFLSDTMKDKPVIEKAMAYLEDVGLVDQANNFTQDLPYGDRRALEIAVALAMEPKIVFLDEPTSGLGADMTQRLAGLIRKIHSRFAIVMIEHDMKFLFDLADYIYVVHWGQVISRGTPAELKKNKWVQASNLGKLI